MVRAAEQLREIMRVGIGDGNTMKIEEYEWAKDWTGYNKVKTRPGMENLMIQPIRTLCKICASFTRETAYAILSTYVSSTQQKDEVTWNPSKNGEYSTKSRYWNLI